MMELSQSFLKRSHQSELMDLDSQDPQEFKHCLLELDRINRLTQSFDVTEKALSYLAEKYNWHQRSQPVRILDFGFGSGEQILLMSKWFKRQSIACQISGVELQSFCLEVAHEKLRAHKVQAQLYLENGLIHLERHSYDLVTSTLLSHHLTDAELVYFLKLCTENSHSQVLINDLYRHIIPFTVAKMGSQFSRNRLVRNDAALSVARSRTLRELEQLRRKHLLNTHSQYYMNWSFRYAWLVLLNEKSE